MPSNVNEYKLDMDDSFGEHSLLTPLRKQIQQSHLPEMSVSEWWYVFMLQFLLWWSLSSIFDAVPSILSISPDDWAYRTLVYLFEVLLGFVTYTVQVPRMNPKVRKFLGIVIACCGIWGCLTILTSAIQQNFGIEPTIVYALTAAITISLGIFHHSMYRQDYLLDQLL